MIRRSFRICGVSVKTDRIEDVTSLSSSFIMIRRDDINIYAISYFFEFRILRVAESDRCTVL